MKGFHDSKKGIGIIFDDMYIVNGARTAFGKYCGSLARISPTDLGIFASRGCIDRCGIDPGEIDQMIAANIGQSSYDAYFVPRHIGLYSGLRLETPELMVQRICASGFETIITAAEQITLGKAECVICTGTENMSLAPTASFGNRMGYMLGQPVFKDMLWEALDDTAAGCPMGMTAENVAAKYGITRSEADEFAITSFSRALGAKEKGYFAEEITPVTSQVFEREGLKPRKVRVAGSRKEINEDEHLRATDLETLSSLPTVFSSTGILTAGNCSGIVDGAASAVVAGRSFTEKKGIKPLSKIIAAASCGVDPKYMGLGPVPAINYLLEMTGLALDNIGLIEINEAFSAQVIGCEKELKLDREKLNVNGGAIALGHPLAASGIRISLSISREMIRRNVKYGIASACIGGGQGTAVLIENIQN